MLGPILGNLHDAFHQKTLLQDYYTLDDHTYGIDTLAFSPSGETLATGSWDSSVKLYPWNLDTLMRYSRELIGMEYIRNNPNMESRRGICDGFEPEEDSAASEVGFTSP